MDNNRLLVSLSQCLSLFPFLGALINIKKIKECLLPVFVLLFVNVAVEIIATIYIEFDKNTNEILHVFTVIEFSLLSLFFAFFFKKYFNPIVIYISIPLFFIVAYVDYKINGLNSADNFSVSVESFILVIYTLFFFYYVLKNLIFDNLLAQPVFWISTAVLFYFSGNFVLFVFANYMMRVDLDKYLLLWSIIHTFFNVLYNIFLGIGIWKTRIR